MSTDDSDVDIEPNDTVRLSADVVSAYLMNNSVSAGAIGELIRTVHASLSGLDPALTAPAAAVERLRPAVPVARSVQEDYIVCLEDGKRLKMLKRYLRSKFNLTPDEYRRR